MAASFVGEFSAMDGDGKLLALMDLVKRCTYAQKLEFVEELLKSLHKDFVADLPPKLSGKIICFLSFDDVLNCLLVSKSWNKTVRNCANFWNACAEDLGLNAQFVRQAMSTYRGLKDVCIAAHHHQKYVKSLTPKPVVVARCPGGESQTYVYAGRGIALRYEEASSNSHSQITIQCMNTPHSMVEVTSFRTVAFSSRIKWASAVEDFIVWKQINGKWLSYDFMLGSLELDEWDDEPISQGFHSITFCPKCHLVAIASEAEDDCEVWDLQVVKLMRGEDSPRKMVYPIPLEQIPMRGVAKRRHVLGGEVMLVPDGNGQDKMGFCKCHRILLQVDNCVSIHKLESVAKEERLLVIHQLLPDAKLSKSLHVFRPSKETDLMDAFGGTGGKGHSSLCISADSQRIGVLHENYLYVWNLDSYDEESCVDMLEHNLPTDTKCIAIGSVYAVLASDFSGVCVVVSSRTGDILIRGCVAESSFNPIAHGLNRFTFYPPVRQEWLNRFDYFDFWPISLVLDSFAPDRSTRERELLAIVGVRTRQRSRGLSLNGLL